MITDDIHLVQRSLQGDERSFRLLYENHVDSLYRFLKQFSRNHDEVEDWVQRAFIKAFRHLDSFQERSRFSTWMFSIGLNEMRSDRRRTNILAFEPPDLAEAPQDEDAADMFEWNEFMRELLSQLDETKKAVFLLHEIEGYSHAEIAEMVGIQEGTSRTVLARTKRWLRERWEQERKAVG